MNVFYLVRHGETENNRAKRLSGWIDTPLTDTGLVPTAKVAARLRDIKIDAVFSSDLGRAFITAYDLTRQLDLTGEIVRLPGLREVNYGDAANMKHAEAYERYPKLDRDTHYTPPNGESLAHMQQRVIATVNELNDMYTDTNILLVAHSGVMAALNASFLGHDFGRHNISEAYPHDYVAIFTVGNGRVTSFEEFKGLKVECRRLIEM